MNAADVAFYGLLAIACWLVLLAAADARRIKRERAEDAACPECEPFVTEGPVWLDEWSDTPTHDALALERLRAGLEGWGK